MADRTLLTGEPANTHDEIMFATYEALQKHGYAGLSIQRIADESEHTKSTFYHHFDGKEDLLLSFAEFILENFQRAFEYESSGDPERDLKLFLGLLLGEYGDGDESDTDEMLGAYIELRSQAVRNEAFRETFTRTSDQYVDHLAGIIEEGIDQGVFDEVDPQATAGFLLTMADGAILLKTTRTDDPMAQLHAEIETYIDHEVVADA